MSEQEFLEVLRDKLERRCRLLVNESAGALPNLPGRLAFNDAIQNLQEAGIKCGNVALEIWWGLPSCPLEVEFFVWDGKQYHQAPTLAEAVAMAQEAALANTDLSGAAACS